MADIAVTCLYSKPFEPQRDVLAESVATYIPEAQFVGYRYEELPKSWKEFYPEIESNLLAARPRIILDLLDQGYEYILFCGADIEFFQHPSKMLGFTQDMCITPHLMEPSQDIQTLHRVNVTGFFNSDLVCFRNTPATRKFLEWQRDIMEEYCIKAPGIFLDQTWLNFCTSFTEVKVVRDLGYNVAYWRVNDGDITYGPTLLMKGVPLVAFQYTGFVNSDQISKYSSKKPDPGLKSLLKSYEDRIK